MQECRCLLATPPGGRQKRGRFPYALRPHRLPAHLLQADRVVRADVDAGAAADAVALVDPDARALVFVGGDSIEEGARAGGEIAGRENLRSRRSVGAAGGEPTVFANQALAVLTYDAA